MISNNYAIITKNSKLWDIYFEALRFYKEVCVSLQYAFTVNLLGVFNNAHIWCEKRPDMPSKKVLLEPLYEDFIYKWHQKFRNETLGKVTKFAEHCLIYKGTVHENLRGTYSPPVQ